MKVIVLGAGVIGVTSAWYLAQAGHEVRVIDRQPSAGMETSFANGGQVSAGHAEPWARPQILPKVLKWLGREDAPLRLRLGADPARWRWALGFVRECAPGRFERNCRALAGLSAYSLECLQELRRSEALEYDALARGILQFCTDERDFEALARHAEQSRAYGMVREVKSATECLEVEPALRHSTLPIVGGVLTPGDESGDAHRFTQELARRCREEGVSFLFDTDVEGAVADVHALLGIRARNDTMKADAYVAALGSYSPLFLRTLGIRIPVYPLKGYSITVPLDERDRAPSVSLTDEAAKVVISRLGNRLRAAGTAELAGYDTSINAARCEAIAHRIHALFPAVKGRAAIERWAGLRPATPSNVPVIGRTRYRNLFINTGHGTLGWTLACGSARALADVVSGRRPEVSFPFAA